MPLFSSSTTADILILNDFLWKYKKERRNFRSSVAATKNKNALHLRLLLGIVERALRAILNGSYTGHSSCHYTRQKSRKSSQQSSSWLIASSFRCTRAHACSLVVQSEFVSAESNLAMNLALPASAISLFAISESFLFFFL